jgi:phage shock protein C
MYCTQCGTEHNDEKAKFCSECGASTARSPWRPRVPDVRLSRPVSERKLGGVCAGFARYLGLDVTLVRILTIVFVLWPVPFVGVIAYCVAWIAMPEDPQVVPAAQNATVTR